MYCEQEGLGCKSLVRAAGLGALFAVGLACQEMGKNSVKEVLQEEDVTAEHYKMSPLPRLRLSFEGSFSRQVEVFWVELAHTPEAAARGLMWRKSLGPREGMLFDFGREGERSFWMKNTLLSLDLVFISEEKRVVGIIERAKPQSLQSLSIGLPSRYVLELPAGTCAKVGVRMGTSLSWQP
ncbi:MAG: DUF192 domain-containing protein [Cystobacterineae bacterium]|nr:DUF192 domain-containing protein [Cystobacterineae bacterium]